MIGFKNNFVVITSKLTEAHLLFYRVSTLKPTDSPRNREYSSVSSNVILRPFVSFIRCYTSLTKRIFISFVQYCTCITEIEHSSVLSNATRVSPTEYSSVSSNVVRVSLRTLVSFIKCFKSLTERTFISFVQCCICVTQNIRQFHQMLHEESHVPRRRTLGQRTFNSCSQRYACLTENACQVHPVLHSVPKKSNSSNANTMFHTKRWSGSSNATRIPRRPWSASSRCCLLQSLGSLAKRPIQCSSVVDWA